MAAPTMSYLIATSALIMVIFTAQAFYMYVVDNIWAETAQRELKEITDYVADTLANLYFLVNSTRSNITMLKTLNLPSEVAGSGYTLEIMRNQSDFAATAVKGSFQGKPWLNITSWLPPGITVNITRTEIIQSGGKTAVAGCTRVSSDIHVWIAYGG